ncbi:MAG TPA: DUF4276 family protein [Kamptonema sp.]|nr:DUF4276 family protein [Kamptonema sp.]
MKSHDNTREKECYFFKFGLLVTGQAEEKHLPKLFRTLMELRICHFEVIRKVEQLGVITSEKKIKMVGSGKDILNKDAQRIGFPARDYLKNPCNYVLLLDDLEHNRIDHAQEIFDRYRKALDTILMSQKHRASVHFLVNMLEAYYFADPDTVNSVLGTSLNYYEGDVETIRHPKGKLKDVYQGFKEIEHGGKILESLNIEYVLSNPNTCASLRTLFAWCVKALGQPFTDKYQLQEGKLSEITKSQLDNL